MFYDKRLIPVLQIHDRRLVKTVKFSVNRYLGDPLNAVRVFNLKGVNELIINDISATQTQKIDFRYLEKLAAQAFVPLAYGGGIKTIDDVDHIFKIGFDRVILGTAAIETPSLIKEIASIYGQQSIICSLDISKTFDAEYSVYLRGGKSRVNTASLEDLIDLFQRHGVGEIMIHDKDRDGTGQGLNIELIRYISSRCSVPTILCGGTVSVDNALEALKSGASAVAIGSLFSYYGPHKAVLINYNIDKDIK